MKKKHRWGIQVFFWLTVVITAAYTYSYFYTIDHDDLKGSLGHYHETEALEVLDWKEVLFKGDKYLLVFYQLEEAYALTMMKEGLAQRYRVIEVHYEEESTFDFYELDHTLYKARVVDASIQHYLLNNLVKPINLKKRLGIFFLVVLVIVVLFTWLMKSGKKYGISDDVTYDGQRIKQYSRW